MGYPRSIPRTASGAGRRLRSPSRSDRERIGSRRSPPRTQQRPRRGGGAADCPPFRCPARPSLGRDAQANACRGAYPLGTSPRRRRRTGLPRRARGARRASARRTGTPRCRGSRDRRSRAPRRRDAAGRKIPTSFSRMNVMIPLNTITHSAGLGLPAQQRPAAAWNTPSLPGQVRRAADADVLDDLRVGEHPDHQAAAVKPGDPVRIDHPQRVVHVSEHRRSAEEPDRHPHDRRGDDADRDRTPAVDETGRRRDRHQPRDHAVDASRSATACRGRCSPSAIHTSIATAVHRFVLSTAAEALAPA